MMNNLSIYHREVGLVHISESTIPNPSCATNFFLAGHNVIIVMLIFGIVAIDCGNNLAKQDVVTYFLQFVVVQALF